MSSGRRCWERRGFTTTATNRAPTFRVREGAQGHPVLQDVPPKFHVRSWLYHIVPDYPPPEAEILLVGSSVGPSPRPVREENPVAWTWRHPGGGRVFTTTMGHPEDFEVPAFRRLCLNGIRWALGVEG